MPPAGQPAMVGQIVPDFSLISCANGEEVSYREHFADQRAALFVLTAGWCPACAAYVPQVLGVLENPQAAGLKIAIVLGDNAQRGPASLRECQQYGRNAGIPIDLLFKDHDGESAFTTVFGHMFLYPNDNGSFGLPWNAVVRPGDWQYMYADGAPGRDLNTILNELL